MAIFSKGKGKYRLEDLQELPLNRVEGHLARASLQPLASFYDREVLWGVGDFLPGKETLLELQIRKTISDTGILQGPFIVRYRILEKTSDYYRISYVAVPTQKQLTFLQYLNPRRNIVKALFPVEAALTALAAPLGPKNLGIIMPTELGYHFIFSQEGSIVYTRSIATTQREDEIDLIHSGLQETLSYLRHSLSFVPQILFTLDPKALEGLPPLPGEIPFAPLPLEKVLETPLPGDPTINAVLLGNLMASPHFNLLDASYMAETRAFQWSRIIHSGALILALVLLALSLWEGKNLLTIRKKYINRYTYLQNEVAQIMKVQPTEDEIKRVKHFLKVYKAYKDQPKLDHLLLWLSLHLPSKATITSMKAFLPTPPPSRNPSPPHPAAAQASPNSSIPSTKVLKVTMDGVLKGDYMEVKGSFYRFISQLERISEITVSRFSYGEGEGLFHLEINYRKFSKEETP